MIQVAPIQSRNKGIIYSAVAFLCFALLAILAQSQNYSLSISLLIIGIIASLIMYFSNLITVPIGRQGIKYFWNEPQKGVILTEGTHWILPFFEKVTWDDITIQSQLFTLNNIKSGNMEPLSFSIVVQYSIIDIHIALYKSTQNRIIKMQQIMTDTLNIEIQQNNISDTSIISNINLLTSYLKRNLSSHMEMQWGTKIEGLSIMSVTHLNNIRTKDLTDSNSLQLQIERVLLIAREFNCTAEEAFKKDLVRTGLVRPTQNINVYSVPEAASVIQSVASLLNNSQ